MAANVTPLFVLTPVNAGVQLTSANTTAKVTILTAGANGTRIDGILVSTNDTTAVNLAFYVGDGTTDHYIGNVLVPIGSGYTTVVRVDAMTILQPVNVPALILLAGYTLKCNAVTTMTAVKVADIVAMGGSY